VIAYWWLVKADVRKPLEYAFVLVLLLSYRAVVWVLPKIQPKKARFFRTGRADVSVKAKP